MAILNIVMFSLLLVLCLAILRLVILNPPSLFRSVMIGYFISEGIALTGLIILELFWREKIIYPTQIILFIIFLPKAIIKIIFYVYTKNR